MSPTIARLSQSLDASRKLLLDAIFPPRCAGCRTWSQSLFCDNCRAALKLIQKPFCITCGKPFDPLAHSAPECAGCRAERRHPAPPFRALRSLYVFDGPVRQAIYRFKYQGKTAQAAPLAALLYEYLLQQDKQVKHIPLERISLIVPVPLHAWRHYRRCYNQSALLAGELVKCIAQERSESIPLMHPLLQRIRHTTPQVGLKAKARAANVQGAFAINDALLQRVDLKAGAILLIDDVCTTQATLHECARVLVRAGAPEVYALTLARQPAGSDYRS
jgi:ComF family protein